MFVLNKTYYSTIRGAMEARETTLQEALLAYEEHGFYRACGNGIVVETGNELDE